LLRWSSPSWYHQVLYCFHFHLLNLQLNLLSRKNYCLIQSQSWIRIVLKNIKQVAYLQLLLSLSSSDDDVLETSLPDPLDSDPSELSESSESLEWLDEFGLSLKPDSLDFYEPI
jgi:hypothetical protein